MAKSSEPHVLDQPWRVWATIAVMGIVLLGVLLGVIIIPVVQGQSAGIGAYDAICRALGITPGSPARQQLVNRSPGKSGVAGGLDPDVLQILAEAKPERGHAKVQEVCVSCHGEQGVRSTPSFRIWRDNPAPPSISN